MRCALITLSIVPLLLLVGCTEPEPETDTGFNLVEDLQVVGVVPSTSSASGYTAVHLQARSRYESRAWIFFWGRCGGSPTGILHAPVEGVIGEQAMRMDLPAGPFDIQVQIEMTCDSDQCALDVTVACDSLWADGSLVDWQSEAGRALYRQDIPENTAFLFNQTWLPVLLDCPTP